jgi:hypothetical protein
VLPFKQLETLMFDNFSKSIVVIVCTFSMLVEVIVLVGWHLDLIASLGLLQWIHGLFLQANFVRIDFAAAP